MTDLPANGEEKLVDGVPVNGHESSDEHIVTTPNDVRPDGQPLFEQPVILEGKRSRKPTLRLELSDLTRTKKELSIPQGFGKPLGTIEYINYRITHASTDALSRMRSICFGRRRVSANIRKNLREFRGFEFPRHSDEYHKHLSTLTKLKKDQLRSISDILGLPSAGRNTEHAERILNFLIEPVDDGRRLPEKKSSTSTSKKLKESIDTDDERPQLELGQDHDEPDTKRSAVQQLSTKNKRKRVSLATPTVHVNGEVTPTPPVHEDDDKRRHGESTPSEEVDQNEGVVANGV